MTWYRIRITRESDGKSIKEFLTTRKGIMEVIPMIRKLFASWPKDES